MTIEEMQARLGEVRSRLVELGEMDELSEEEAREFDTLDSEETDLRETIETTEARQERIAEFRDAVEQGETRTESGEATGPTVIERVDPFQGDDVRYLRPGQVRDRALAALDRKELTDHLRDDQKVQVESLLRHGRTTNFDPAGLARMLLVTERPEYRSGFQKVITSPTPLLTAEEARALEAYRAMSIGTDASGGFGVPVFIDPSIILTGQGSSNALLRISRVETITNDEWKGVSSAGVTWSFDAEATEVSDDSPTLAQPNVKVHKAQGFIPYSIEVGGDYPGFAQEMSTLLTEGYDELLAEKLATGAGDGSNEPFGILTALDANTNVEVTPTTDGSLGAVDIYKVWKELPERYRGSASWVMDVDVNNEVRSLGDDKLHQQTVNLTEGSVDRLLGRPVYQNAYFPEFTGTTGAANILVVGDFSNYLIARRLGMTVELVPHLFATGNNRPSGERGWYAYARVGADSVNDLGFRLLQNQ